MGSPPVYTTSVFWHGPVAEDTSVAVRHATCRGLMVTAEVCPPSSVESTFILGIESYSGYVRLSESLIGYLILADTEL